MPINYIYNNTLHTDYIYIKNNTSHDRKFLKNALLAWGIILICVYINVQKLSFVLA